MIYILNEAEEIEAILDNDGSAAAGYWNDEIHEKLNDAYMTLKFTMSAYHESAASAKVGGKVITHDKEGNLQIFDIKSADTIDDEKEIYAEHLALELNGRIIRPTSFEGVTAEQYLNQILGESRWKIGTVEWFGTKTITFEEHTTAIQSIMTGASEFEGEFQFRVNLTHGKVSGCYVDLIERRGRDTGIQVTYDHNATRMRRFEDSSQVYTALIGLARGESEGYLTFESVTAEDKPLGQDWIGDEEALQRFGILQENGERQHYFGVYTWNGTGKITPERLLMWTRRRLAQVSKPKMTYEVDVVELGEHLSLGDGLSVKNLDYEPPLLVSARVVEYIHSKSDSSKDKLVIGDYRDIWSESPFAAIESLRQAILRNATQWEDAGTVTVRSAVQPTDTEVVWVDTSNAAFDIIKTYNPDTGLWENAAPTAPGDIGAEDPEGAWEKAREAQKDAELTALGQRKNVLLETKTTMDGQYDEVYNNAYLYAGTEKSYLASTKSNVDSTYNSLVAHINDLITRNSFTVTEQDYLQTLESDFQAASNPFYVALEAAQHSIIENRSTEAEKVATDYTVDYAEQKITKGTIAPSAPVMNELWLDTNVTPAVWRQWNGTEWAKFTRTDLEEMLGQIGTLQLEDFAVTTNKLVDDAVTNMKVQNGAIDNPKLANLTVQAEKLANGIIDDTKLADLAVTASKLGSGSVIESKIDLGAVTNTKLADLAVSAAKLADGSVTNLKIGSNAVTSAKLSDLAVTASKLASNSVTDLKILDGAILEAKIAANAVTELKISSGAVTNSRLAALAVDAAKLASNAVTETKISLGAVTNTKLANLAVDAAKLADGAVSELKLDNLAVTNPKLAALAVDAGKLADGSVLTDKIGPDAVTSAKLADLSVLAANLASGAVIESKLASSAVTNTKLAALAVDAGKLADSSVTAQKIANLAVGSAAIADAAISNAKLDRASVNKIVIGTADIADLAVTNAAIANSAINAAKIADLSVGSAEIADTAITSAKIANLAVGNAAIASSAIDSAKIKDLSVATGDIANLAVNSAKIANLAVGTAALQDAVITNAKLDRASANKILIGEADIADLAVTEGKIANLAVGTGAIQDLAVTSAKIKEIDATKITTGRLDAARVQIGSGTIFDEGFDPTTKQDADTRIDNMISSINLPYLADLVVYGDSNKYYPVYIWSGNQNVLRTIKIWRSYQEQGPDDWNTATHKGSLMLSWKGNFGGWGGADYRHFIEENSSQYTELLADAKWMKHRFGYIFFLRGGGTTGAIYHFASDQPLDKASSGTEPGPIAYYNGSQDLVYDHTTNDTYDVYAEEPLTAVNTEALEAITLTRNGEAQSYADQALADAKEYRDLWAYPGTTFIDGGDIYTNSVTANQIAVGTITAASGILADLAVTNAAIANSAINSAKIQDLAVASGDIANLAVTDGKIANLAVGAAAIQSAAITNAKLDRASANKIVIDTADIASAAIQSAQIDALAVGSGAIANLAVTEGKIANLAVGTGAIKDAAITNAKIDSLDATKITTGYLAAARIAARSLNASVLVAGSLTANEIASSTITGTKIAGNTITASNIAANTITSNLISTAGLDAGVIKTGSLTGITVEVTNAGMTAAGTLASDIRIWAGASYSSRASAPFRVQHDGKVVASNIDITGGSIKIGTSAYIGNNLYLGSRATDFQEKRIYFNDLAWISGGTGPAGADIFLTAQNLVLNWIEKLHSTSDVNVELRPGSSASFMKWIHNAGVETEFYDRVRINAPMSINDVGAAGNSTYFTEGYWATNTPETGYCGTGGVTDGITTAVSGVGVNFRVTKSYVPSSISISTKSSNIQYSVDVSAIDISGNGFWLYINGGTSTPTYRYWRGNYTA